MFILDLAEKNVNVDEKMLKCTEKNGRLAICNSKKTGERDLWYN